MNEEQELAIVRAYSHGDSVVDIIKKFETNHARFYRILKRHNVTLRIKSSREQRDAKRDAVIRDYRKGLPVKSIRRKHKISKHALYALLRTNKVPIRRCVQQIVYDYEKGLPVQEIITKNNLKSNSIVYRIVGRYGLKPRNNWTALDVNAIAEDYQKGVRIKAIMRKHSINNRAKIRYHLRKAGVILTRLGPTPMPKSSEKSS